jgi:hypothetical protein
VPIPPQLTALLQQHLADCGTAPGGRLFRAARGGILHESYYDRTWHTARAAALGPALAATPLARRPYDLRHAALSLWLASGAPPAEIAARAGHSTHVLLSVYAHSIPGHGQIASHAIEQASARTRTHPAGRYPATGTSRRPERRSRSKDHPHNAADGVVAPAGGQATRCQPSSPGFQRAMAWCWLTTLISRRCRPWRCITCSASIIPLTAEGCGI